MANTSLVNIGFFDIESAAAAAVAVVVGVVGVVVVWKVGLSTTQDVFMV